MISQNGRSYYNRSQNSVANGVEMNSSTLLTDDTLSTLPFSEKSVESELQKMSNSLTHKFDEIKDVLSSFSSNISCIQKEEQLHKSKESNKNVVSPFTTTLKRNSEDFSYYRSNNQELFYKDYFLDSSTLPYDFKVINFFLQLLSVESTTVIELYNFEDFKNCLIEKKIHFKKKYAIIYMIDRKKQQGHKAMLTHYLCLVDVKKLEIHVINPLNDYSVNSDVINLKLLIDLSYNSDNTLIKICHTPITAKLYNSGCHTFLNIYSLVSDMNQYLSNVNSKANDQFTFFIPDNPNIRNQCYTVLTYLLENCSNKKGMEHYQYYKEYIKNILR